MLHPSYHDLIQAVNSGVEPGEEPVVQSRYSIVIATAKRARQLIAGEDAMVPSAGRKPLSVAVKIVSEDDTADDVLPAGAASYGASEAAETEEEALAAEDGEPSEMTE